MHTLEPPQWYVAPQRAERATCGGASYMTPRAVNMHRFHHVALSVRRRSLNVLSELHVAERAT